jgi:hypothetical protein
MKTRKAIHFVRSGEMEVQQGREPYKTLGPGDIFGQESFTDDGTYDETVYAIPDYSIKMLKQSVVGTLTLRDARSVFDTAALAGEDAYEVAPEKQSLFSPTREVTVFTPHIKFKDLKKAGTSRRW